MDFGTLQAQIRASRQITAKADGATFTIELPSDHAWRITLEANRDEAGRLLQAQVTDATLSMAITGWADLTERYLLPEAPAESLPFSAAARSELLDARQDIADQLIAKIISELAERQAKRDAARKN